MVGVGASALLRAMAAIIRGDVLSEDDVAGTRGVRAVRFLDHGLFLEDGEGGLIQFAHHPGCEASEEESDDGEG